MTATRSALIEAPARPAPPARRIRILGLDNEGATDFRDKDSRYYGLYHALSERFDVVETASPRMPRWESRLNMAVHFLPQRDLWRNRAGLNPWRFRRRSEAARRIVAARAGDFDVILQLYLLFDAGPGHPYVQYLDSTMAITARQMPRRAPLTHRERYAWIRLERDAYHRADYLFPMSGLVRDSLIEDYGCDPDRIVTVGAGTNMRAESLADARWDRRIVLFVGLDYRLKGGDSLLAAWDSVAKRVPGAELWLAGTRRAYGRPRPDVRFFGRIPRSELRRLYEQASVFALPSRFDAFPNVLREAMGHGLPCIATTVGGIPEIVRDGETGVLVPPKDPAALSAALIDLLSDPARAESMSRAGYALVREQAGWEHVAERMAPYIEAAARGEPVAAG